MDNPSNIEGTSLDTKPTYIIDGQKMWADNFTNIVESVGWKPEKVATTFQSALELLKQLQQNNAEMQRPRFFVERNISSQRADGIEGEALIAAIREIFLDAIVIGTSVSPTPLQGADIFIHKGNHSFSKMMDMLKELDS